MAEIEILSTDYWATSDGVRDKIDIPHQGDPADVESSIDSATDTVQTWVQDATGWDYPDELPDPATLATDNPLLVRATEYLAASEEHEKRAEQIRATDDTPTQPRYVFLEERAHSKFENWVTRHGHDETGTTGETGTTRQPRASPGGQISSLVDLGSGGGR